jgi:hypothetical protein
MDIDFEKNIVDLSEKLTTYQQSGTTIKQDQQHKVTVELSKEEYLVVSFKQNR